MRLWAILACVMIASACSGPAKTDRWAQQNPTATTSSVPIERTICTDIRELALRPITSTEDIPSVLDELSRVGAITGATTALVDLLDVRELLNVEHADLSTPLAAAAADLDQAGFTECEIPTFTALYVSSTFAACVTPVAVAAHRFAPDAESCSDHVAPTFLPCWDEEQGYLPIDCRNGDDVVLENGEWVAA